MSHMGHGGQDEVRKEDFISKFQINEIIPLLRIAEKFNIDIGEGKKLLVKALHTARTTRNLDEIVGLLEGSKREIERALQNHFIRWHSLLKLDMDKKREFLPQDSQLPNLIDTARVFVLEKNYDTSATLLGRCELELMKLITAPTVQPQPAEEKKTEPPAAKPLSQEIAQPAAQKPAAPSPAPHAGFSFLTPHTAPRPATPAQPQPAQQPQAPAQAEQAAPQPLKPRELDIVERTVPAKPAAASEIGDAFKQPSPAAQPAVPQQPEEHKHKNYQIITVHELARCGVCMGKIKAESKAIECQCGIYFHESCGKRLGKCPNCEVTFEG